MSTQGTRRTGSTKRVIVFTLLIVLMAVVLYIAWSWRAKAGFESQFKEYSEAQVVYIIAANKPAAESNPVRREVYRLLAEVLQVEMTNEERIVKAKQGIAHLNDLETQIDAIKTEADIVRPMLDELEALSSGVSSINGGSAMKEIVRLGRRQVEIISDIRGLSYRADFYTSEVFERIIDDQGAMTDAHKQYLNDMIPQLEEQFDLRANLYAELTSSDGSMKDLARDLGYEGE